VPRTADASDFDAVDAAFGEADENLGGVDAAAHCVGSMLLKPAHLIGAEAWEKVVATNLTSAFAVVRAAGWVIVTNDLIRWVPFVLILKRAWTDEIKGAAAARRITDG